MPTSKAQSAAPEQPEFPRPLYPVIESFVESASPDDVTGFFAELKTGLTTIKGPKAEHSKKVAAAIASTEELLRHLLEVREKLEKDHKGSRGRK